MRLKIAIAVKRWDICCRKQGAVGGLETKDLYTEGGEVSI